VFKVRSHPGSYPSSPLRRVVSPANALTSSPGAYYMVGSPGIQHIHSRIRVGVEWILRGVTNKSVHPNKFQITRGTANQKFRGVTHHAMTSAQRHACQVCHVTLLKQSFVQRITRAVTYPFLMTIQSPVQRDCPSPCTCAPRKEHSYSCITHTGGGQRYRPAEPLATTCSKD